MSGPLECDGKEGFDTMELAQRVATRSRGYGKSRRRREAYRCVFCKRWHVGTPLRIKRWDR